MGLQGESVENLKYVLKTLKSKRDTFNGDYFIPETWNTFGFSRFSVDKTRKGQQNVNPYEFMIGCIERCILPNSDFTIDYLHSDKNLKGKELNLSKNFIYSVLQRMFTAWDHYEEGKICGGTFLKAICLLPYLRKMKVDIIYMLPIFEYSNICKKGEIGSPYAIKNIYKVDINLHDSLLGDCTDELVEIEFKAFVEACHILGIKVMLDFVFRTVSRDNDMIEENPEWFYWIDKKQEKNFNAPYIEKEKNLTLLTENTVKSVYESEGLRDYISKFSYSPKELDPEKWEKVLKRHKNTNENILELIEQEFNITTAPGFSDVINDPQPPWTDVTYIKFYLDTNKIAKKYIGEKHVPYILHDGIKLNLFKGRVINKKIWDYVVNAIPHYQKNFGIDGARIDMGHALPQALNKEIISKAKKNNSNFILWSEEFQASASKLAKDGGFNFISGKLWEIYRGVEWPGFNRELFENVVKSKLPVAAAVETPDTPRAIVMHHNKKRLEMIILLNSFLPNVVPFINNGMEVMERQPMNLGLGNTEEGKYVLPQHDSMYGKIAFFDNYMIHWLSKDHEWMLDLMQKSFDLRKRFGYILGKKENFIIQDELKNNDDIVFICYYDEEFDKGVFFLASRRFNYWIQVNIAYLLPEKIKEKCKHINLVYAGWNVCDVEYDLYHNKGLMPGEVIIGTIN